MRNAGSRLSIAMMIVCLWCVPQADGQTTDETAGIYHVFMVKASYWFGR